MPVVICNFETTHIIAVASFFSMLSIIKQNITKTNNFVSNNDIYVRYLDFSVFYNQILSSKYILKKKKTSEK